MSTDIRDRLRRLGIHKGASHLKPSPAKLLELERERLGLRPERDPAPRHEDYLSQADIKGDLDARQSAPTLEDQVDTPSEPIRLTDSPTPYGPASYRRVIYPLDHQHGDRLLQQALMPTSAQIARLAGRGIAGFDLSDALFIDTETTGLAGGAGTLAFLVGVGYFDGGQRTEDGSAPSPVSRLPSSFIIDQYFLRDPADEMAMLHDLDQRLGTRQHLVTFNGRGFDVPLLETRFTLSRMPTPFEEKLHLDLLMPARRLWRNMLSSCSLGSLEYHLLAVQRDQQDIAGFLIPQLYREWLANNKGDLNQDMQRVMYHNLYDILSMVTLTARLCEAFAQPAHPSEHLAIGREHERSGAWDQAEQAYRQAVDSLPKSDATVLRRLAHALKRQGKFEEALTHWQALATQDDSEALIELAKHYEWRANDWAAALDFSRRALGLNRNPPEQQELNRRIERLERKLQGPSRPA